MGLDPPSHRGRVESIPYHRVEAGDSRWYFPLPAVLIVISLLFLLA